MELLTILFINLVFLNFLDVRAHIKNGYDDWIKRDNLTVNYNLANATESDVIYKLFTDPAQIYGKYVGKQNITSVRLNTTLPSVLLIHGWTSDDTSPWYKPLKDAYFKKGPHNIFYINYSKAGNLSFVQSVANAERIGRFISEFLITSNIDGKNIYLAGHSLGAHVSGFIGKHFLNATGANLAKIFGLDPGGVVFEDLNPSLRLSKNDAAFVEIIHSDIQWYGFTFPCGHVDFYVNDGHSQPGCPSRKVDDNCSHARSTLYFVESVNKNITAHQAKFEEEGDKAIIEEVEHGKEVLFGCNTPPSARGVYSLHTNAQKPFF